MKKSEKVLIGVSIALVILVFISGLIFSMNVVDIQTKNEVSELRESCEDLKDACYALADECLKVQEEYDLTDDELCDIVDVIYLSTISY